MKIKFGITPIDSLEYYKTLLKNDRSREELKYIPTTVILELSENIAFSKLLLTHPYYKIRAAYASITSTISDQQKLSLDINWAVRLSLATNPKLNLHLLEVLKHDIVEDVRIQAKLTSDKIKSLKKRR